MPGTESQKAFDLLDERFPQSDSQGAEARLVFQAPDGQRVTATENKAAVEDTLGSLDGGDQVASTTDPYETGAVSEDGTIAYSTITYTAEAVDLTEPTKSALEDAASQARDAGLTVEIGGSALESEESPGGTTEIIGVVVAAVVLVLTLGSPSPTMSTRPRRMSSLVTPMARSRFPIPRSSRSLRPSPR
ncbi:MMPL family transporter [Streptomyces montanus]|uniref:MMPL family transporter n=1 Tax=Streptomyces montanus TaxID=2580423 RepID=UPI001FE9BA6D|nr:MMPL family transporter [Streptomyces montanus]